MKAATLLCRGERKLKGEHADESIEANQICSSFEDIDSVKLEACPQHMGGRLNHSPFSEQNLQRILEEIQQAIERLQRLEEIL